MTSPFNVQVKVDPAQAMGAAKSIGTELGRTEAKGVEAGKAIGDAFDKASVKGQKAASAARAAASAFKSVADGIRSQALGAASSALAGLTRQLEHEAEILRRLRGPMDDYKRDIEAINMLHRKGMLSAREYGQAMADARRGLGGGSVASSIDNRTGLPKGADGGLGGKLSGMATAAAPYMAGAYAGKQVLDLADAHTSLANRLDASTSAAIRSNRVTMTSAALYDRLHDVAQDTRTSIDATTTSYLGLSSATSKLGMSQEQTIAMTETLNKLTARADSQSRDAGLRQLGQALASGRLQGDEFKSISENLPELRDAIADALGVGADKLREMSTEGKLTSKVLVEAFGKMGAAADAAFASSKATYSDRLTQAKNAAIKWAPGAIEAASGGGFLEEVLRDRLHQIEVDAQYQKANMAAYVKEHGGVGPDGKRRNESGDIVALSKDEVAAKLKAVIGEMEEFGKAALSIAGAVTAAALETTKGYREGLKAAKDQLDVTRQLQRGSITGFSDSRLSSMGLIPNAQLDQDRIGNEFAVKRMETPGAAPALDYEEKVKSLKASISNLGNEYLKGTIGAESFAYANKQLQSQLSSLTGSIDSVSMALDYDQRVKALTTAMADLRAAQNVNAVSAKGAAYANKQLSEQLLALTGGVNYWKRIWDDIHGPQRDFTGGVAALNSIMASGRITMQQYNEEFRKLSEAYDKSGFAKLFNDATTTKMQTPRPHGAQVADAERRYFEESLGASTLDTSPNLERDLAQYDKQVAAAKDYQQFLLDVQRSTAEWQRESVTATDVVGNAWDAMVAKATDVAGAMESVFTSAYQGIEDALTSLITKQKLDMQSFVNMMLEQMARLAIRSAIGGIAGAISQSQTDDAVQQIATGGALGDLGGLIFDPGWGPSARTAQPTSPTIGPAATGGVSARAAGGNVNVIVNQDRDALLPALDRNNGRRVVANIALREAGPALAKRTRYS